MRVMPSSRKSRPIATRIPSEPVSSPRQYFRYWPLDLPLHIEMVAGLHGAEATSPPSLVERWLTYIESLDDKKLTTSAVVTTAESLWHTIAKSSKSIMPPNARPTDDEGLRLSWNRKNSYLEILISGDGMYEWFYTDSNNVFDSADGLSLESDPSALLEHIVRLF
jgi:hypothetical protein